MNKNKLRKFLKNYPINLGQKTREESYLLQSLWDFVHINSPKCIGLYAAIEHEPDLTCIFDLCISKKIKVAYPRIANDQLIFHEITSPNILISSTFGIPEPLETAPVVVPDFIVVPGLAFTKEGKRLGRGKGHYDKYLSIHSPNTISLAFSWQLLEDLPTEPHDVNIQTILYFNI